MHLDRKSSKKLVRVLTTTTLALLLAITSFSVAFGDFAASSSSTKILGVGRIQSAPIEAPVQVETKFATYTHEGEEQNTELSAPVVREVTVVEIVEVVQDPEPDPVVENVANSPAQETPQATNPGYEVPISDQEMLDSIIYRESRHNVYATNGRYKGIGQLQEHHYEMYVGLTYAQTLEQPDPYAVQLQAMLGYIYNRYGNIATAYNFWNNNGWY